MPEHTRTYQIASEQPEHLRGWTTDRLLLGHIFDAINLLTHLMYNINSDKPLKDSPTSIIPVPPKSVTKQAAVLIRPSEAAGLLGL